MYRFRNAMVPAAAALVLAAGCLCAAGAQSSRQVTRIRFWTAPEKTRVVLDMSGESLYLVSERSRPDRIVIDVPRGRFASGVGAIEVGDGVISRIRVNALSSGAQIVIDLPAAATYRHFALDPNDVHPRHRIVIDIDRALSGMERRSRDSRARRVAESGDMIVIVDPGHGGSKPGTASRHAPAAEKVYALLISKMITEEISSRPGFRAVLTRTGDYDVDLYDRIRKARDHGGHCFVSVHLNGNDNFRLRGSEVYFLALEGTMDEHAASVAERENMQLEQSSGSGALGGDVQSILFDLARSGSMQESARLADQIAAELRREQAIPFRGVRQGNFLVLRGISMPSVLLELAYLTNQRDAAEIRKEAVQRRVARSVADGVVAYLLANPPEGVGRRPEQLAVHVVAKGETLTGIARKYRCTVDDLRELNRLGTGSIIRPGQKLTVYANGR